MRILAESCLRDVNGDRMALETASSLLVPDEEELPSLTASMLVRWPRLLSLWCPWDLLEAAMGARTLQGRKKGQLGVLATVDDEREVFPSATRPKRLAPWHVRLRHSRPRAEISLPGSATQ